MSKGNGRIVPLGIVANHGGGVLHAVRPFDVPAPPVGVENVTKNDEDRDAVGVRVIDRHGGVLKPYGAVSHHHHRLAFYLCVAVGHGNGRLFMTALQQLRTLVAPIIDQRFVKTAEARTGIGSDVLETQRLDHVDHEIRPGAIGRIDVDSRIRRGCFRRGLRGRQKETRHHRPIEHGDAFCAGGRLDRLAADARDGFFEGGGRERNRNRRRLRAGIYGTERARHEGCALERLIDHERTAGKCRDLVSSYRAARALDGNDGGPDRRPGLTKFIGIRAVGNRS